MDHILRELSGGILLLLIFVVIGLLASIRRWPERWRRLRSAHWPTVPGTIESGDVSTVRSRRPYVDRGIESATAQLGYSYRLNGTYYSGYHTEIFNDEQTAWSYVDAVKGQAVQVSYNLGKPDESVLRRPPTSPAVVG